MATDDEYTDNSKKKALEAWEQPLRMPRAVPKPVGKKKKSRFDKKEPKE